MKNKLDGIILRLGALHTATANSNELAVAKKLEEALDDLRAVRDQLEAREKPGALICWVEGIQGHGSCTLTTGHCGFLTYDDAEAWRKNLIEKNPNMAYVKLFEIYVKETR